jgi:hypothetical protein
MGTVVPTFRPREQGCSERRIPEYSVSGLYSDIVSIKTLEGRGGKLTEMRESGLCTWLALPWN